MKNNSKPLDIMSFKNSGLKLYDIQPEECRKPLVISDENTNWRPHIKRLFEFDPTPIYDRINEESLLNPYMRQCTVSISFLFPKVKGICSCGCGKVLEGRRTRWASDDCEHFARAVFSIISGYSDSIRTYRSLFLGDGWIHCEICGPDSFREQIELDHIFPVKFGGGGGWLSNYQFKCKTCHRKKTNADFGFKQKTRQQILF